MHGCVVQRGSEEADGAGDLKGHVSMRERDKTKERTERLVILCLDNAAVAFLVQGQQVDEPE